MADYEASDEDDQLKRGVLEDIRAFVANRVANRENDHVYEKEYWPPYGTKTGADNTNIRHVTTRVPERRYPSPPFHRPVATSPVLRRGPDNMNVSREFVRPPVKTSPRPSPPPPPRLQVDPSRAQIESEVRRPRHHRNRSPIVPNVRRDFTNVDQEWMNRATERFSRRNRAHHRVDTTTDNRALFETVLDANVTRDVTVHFNLPLFEDFDAEVENFSRFSRLGNFTAAREFFEQNLKAHLDHPVVFIQYAEALLDMGDYNGFELLKLPKSFKKLQMDDSMRYTFTRARIEATKSKSWNRQSSTGLEDPTTTTMHGGWGEDGYPHPAAPLPTKIGRMQEPGQRDSSYDETSFLTIIWSLLNALFNVRRNNTMNNALDEASFVLDALAISSDFSSTEVRL